MYSVRSDPGKNRLYVVLKGRSDASEVGPASAEIVQHLARLKPGFDVVSDLSEAVPVGEEARQGVGRIMEALKARGMRRAVRIVKGDVSTVAAGQFARTSMRLGYTGMEARSVAEADCLLDAAR